MPGIKTETTVQIPDKRNKYVPPPLKAQTDMLVDSFCPPHTAEYISAQRALTQDCATLELIDNDIHICRQHIARAQAQIRLLERQRGAIVQRVSIHRARLSPLRTIPDQLLQEIFSHCLPNKTYVVPSPLAAPLVLVHVCRRWRAVAHGTSELWSALTLHDHGVWTSERELEMARAWLARAHMRPLRLGLTCPPWRTTGASDVLRLVLEHGAHLRALRLTATQPYLAQLFGATRLPGLRALTLALHPADDPPAPVPVSVSAPRLTHLALTHGTSAHAVPPALLAGLTHLTLDAPPDVAGLFRACPRLVHLALVLPYVYVPELHRERAVGMLRTLEVRMDADVQRFGDPAALEELLDRLELPVLERLIIASANGMAVQVPAAAHELLGRSRCPRPRLEWQALGEPGRQGNNEFENGLL